MTTSLMPLYRRCGAAWLLSLVMAGCSPESHDAPTAAVAPFSDSEKPVDLKTWRAIQSKGEAVLAIADLDRRISACREFLERHPDHAQSLKVIQALTAALVTTGEAAPEELSRLVIAQAKLDKENLDSAVELVRTYHKHGLLLESGLAVLDLGRRRIELERKDTSYRRPDTQTEYRDLTLRHQQVESWLVEAWLYLQHDRPREALDALAGIDLVRDAADLGLAPQRGSARFYNGADDARLVLRAAALQRLGRRDEAHAALASSLGFFDDPEMSKLYETLQEEFGLKRASVAVKAPPLPAQDFALKDLDGDIVRLSDYRDDVVLVTFWATWCAYCPREMAELQAFQREQADRAVTVLTISIDEFRDRPKIRPFLERFGLDLPVLLEEPKQLTGYNYAGGIPALYVIDREGRIAHARLGYDPTLKDRLAGEIGEIVAGDRESGRSLVTIEYAPAGYGLRWQQPMSDQIDQLAVAPPIGDQPGEIAAMNQQGLMRWSASGSKLGSKPISGWVHELHVADLDGDGAREWVAGSGPAVKLFGAEGSFYWNRPFNDLVHLVGIHDLNGDGFQEIIVQDSARVTALQANAEPLWVSRPFPDLASAVIGPTGDIVVQADGRLFRLDEQGERIEIENAAVAEGRLLAARVETAEGEVSLFAGLRERFVGGPAERFPLVDADVDGDGRDDVIAATRHGVVAYDTDGAMLLHVRGHDVSIGAIAAGDVDGQPGDEIVLFIGQYGLIMLGPTPSTSVVAGEFPPIYRTGVKGYQ